ncbi:MAG: HAD family hydrolase [Gammaproteobacteria bacterium]|jgi:putative hydrolase of the HAD superfamily
MSPALSQVRALCFDLDDTFWEVKPVLVRAEARVAEFIATRHPGLSPHLTAESVFDTRLSLAAEHPARAHDMTWLRTEAFRRIAAQHGHDPAIGDAAFEVFMAARNQVELFDDVQPALTVLGARYAMATFSNGNADLGRIGLDGHFVGVLNAESVGCAKPRAEAFHAAAAALGVAPHEMLYVGDHPHLDVAGARAAGCRAAWLNRVGASWPEGLSPGADLEVPDLLALARRLGA